MWSVVWCILIKNSTEMRCRERGKKCISPVIERCLEVMRGIYNSVAGGHWWGSQVFGTFVLMIDPFDDNEQGQTDSH